MCRGGGWRHPHPLPSVPRELVPYSEKTRTQAPVAFGGSSFVYLFCFGSSFLSLCPSKWGEEKKNKQKPRRSEITTLCLLLKKRRERSASSASWRRDCGSQFADMPLVSESGCSGGGTGSIPAGRDESMQRERGREGGGREHMQEQVRVPFYFVSFLSPFQLKGNI